MRTEIFETRKYTGCPSSCIAGLITGSGIAVDSDLRCPQCLAPMETQDHHVWQCKDARARKARCISMTELWSKLVTVAGSFVTWTILTSCCKQWLEHNAVSCNALPAGYVQKLIPSYDNSSSYHGGSAVTTKHRMELCHERIPESDMTDSTGRARKHARTQMQQDKNGALCYVLQTIWKFHNNMWQNSRNEILHLSPPMAKWH